MDGPEVERLAIATPDGRLLAVESGGDPSGLLVLVHGGTPNSRHLHPRWLADAGDNRIRLVSYDRPGYGGSTEQPGRTVADCASDVRAIAAALGVKRLAIWGYSGGGPHALACAALLPDLVSAVAVFGSLAPFDAPGLDFFAGMGEDNAADFRLMLADPAAARAKSRQDRLSMLQATPEAVVELLKTLLSPPDAAALNAGFAAFLTWQVTDGLARSDEGWWEDAVAHMSPWGFDLGAIRIPVQVWHGRLDRFVPVQHGAWLAGHVPGAEAHLSETEGHLTQLLDRVPEAHRWLAQHLSRDLGAASG